VLRIAVSVSILALILSRTSAEALLMRASGGALPHLAAALALLLFAVVLVALRWRLVARGLGLAVPVMLAMRAVFVGVFGGQLLPSALGTDFLRGWLLARHTGGVRRVAASLVVDRLVALFAVCLLLLLSDAAPGQFPVPYAGVFGPAAVVVSGGALLAVILFCTGTLKAGAVLRVPAALTKLGPVDGVALRAGPILLAIVAAIAVHAIAIIAAMLAARAYGVDASLRLWLSIIPLSLIAAAVPISISGWGVREGVIVALAAPMGVPADDALLVSLTLGALSVIASLPGALILLRRRDLV
jgi:uncharacterized membrane protein YbhN (UPF0104 family)